MQGKLLIFSAPSGSGKTTIVKHLLNVYPQLQFSVSACTRPMRSGELNGKDYYFLSVEEFKEKIKNNEFIEWEEVYPGQYYGTLYSEIQRIWNEGKHIIFDIDVVGGINVKKKYPLHSLAVFIQAPGIEVLEKRLLSRLTESEESFKKRISKVKEEMKFAAEFDTILINDRLDLALKDAEKIVADFLRT
jgi:guanylate kinase